MNHVFNNYVGTNKQKLNEVKDYNVKWELAVQELKSKINTWLSNSIYARQMELKDRPFGNCENIVIKNHDQIVYIQEVRFENGLGSRFEMYCGDQGRVWLEYNFDDDLWEYRDISKRFHKSKRLNQSLFLNLLRNIFDH